ncbi:MAG: YetF domain-containing protein [Pseudomonadota bacterium]
MAFLEHWTFGASVFGDSGSPLTWWQMSARAVVAFVYGIALVRVAGTRVFGKSAAFDIILSVIIGSNLSRALTGNAPLWEVLVTTSLLVGLHWLVAELAFRNKAFATLVKGKPKVLIRDGERVERTISREEIGDRDLQAALRSAGIEEIGEVDRAVLERDGSITVRAKDGEGEGGGRA